MKKLNAPIVGGILIILHLVGIVGYITPQLQEYFFLLTPLNLLLSGVLVYGFHTQKSVKFALTIIIIGLAGFMVEVLGVHTSFPFGSYRYLTTLGFKLWEVPVVLAINWALLIYCTFELANRFTKSSIWTILIAALLMVGLDFLIEPVAIKYYYWVWDQGAVPIQNYLAWFIISILFHLYFKYQLGKVENPIAPYIIIAQALYFGMLNML